MSGLQGLVYSQPSTVNRQKRLSIQPSAVSRQPWPLATLREWLTLLEVQT